MSDVARQYSVRVNRLIIKEAICCLELGTTQGLRERNMGFLRQSARQCHKALRATCIAQLSATEFVAGPVFQIFRIRQNCHH
ncbi:hypothetical protein N234_33960 [Ralstonia pickettii DTP0602]|nr:hypothetical protein N234_33960 [Ralstonia pickettii DTP0602]